MEEQDARSRRILLYYFRKGMNTSQAHKKSCAVYGNEALKERQYENWFAKFRSANFSLKNAQRSDRPVEVDETRIKAIIDSDRHSTTSEIAEKLNVSRICIKKKLKQLGYVKKLDLWVPRQLIRLFVRFASETQWNWSISETTDYWRPKVDSL